MLMFFMAHSMHRSSYNCHLTFQNLPCYWCPSSHMTVAHKDQQMELSYVTRKIAMINRCCAIAVLRINHLLPWAINISYFSAVEKNAY